MTPVIKIFPRKRFIGKRMKMSLAANRTPELWRSFMPERQTINGRNGDELYSIERYPPGYFRRFDPSTELEKWAAVEVAENAEVPDGMEALTVETGDYAVFHYKGNPNKASYLFQYIFTEWFPSSGFEVDDRPHFAIMGKKYNNNSDDSEEDLCIPLKPTSRADL